jgi:hypothetical protein
VSEFYEWTWAGVMLTLVSDWPATGVDRVTHCHVTAAVVGGTAAQWSVGDRQPRCEDGSFSCWQASASASDVRARMKT